MLYVCRLDWHIAPFRGDRWLDAWEPVVEKCTAYGAKSWSLTRAIDDRLAFQQTMVWEDKEDFERYWYSQELAELRVKLQGYFNVPVLPEFYEVLGEGQTLSLAPAEPS